MRKFVAHTVVEVQKNCTRSRTLAAGVVCTQRGGGGGGGVLHRGGGSTHRFG